MNTKSLIPCVVAGATGALLATLAPLLLPSTQAQTKLLPFQGRLTNADGTPITPDQTKVVEFKMYDAPTGGNVKWAGEVHKLSVNGGLVNTMLGSKASLGSVDFSTPCYLQITVDANTDNQITAADPPLLPRQSVVPAVFAMEAGNSRKLNGADWTSLMVDAGGSPSNTPVEGFVKGSKIQSGGITGTQLANNAVASAQLADGSVATTDLANGSVTDAKLAVGAIGTSAILNGSILAEDIAAGGVRLSNIYGRRSAENGQQGQSVGQGGLARSPSSGNVPITGESWQDVANLSVTIQTTGRPVILMLTADLGVADPASAVVPTSGYAYTRIADANGALPGTVIDCGHTASGAAIFPPGAFTWIVPVAAGTHQFRVQTRPVRNEIQFRYVNLIAIEL